MSAQLKEVALTLPCSQLLPLKVLQTSVTHCAADCLYKVVSDGFHPRRLFYCVCQCIRTGLACLQRLLFCGFSADHPLEPSSLSDSWNRNHCE